MVKGGNLTLLLMAMGFSNQFIGNENFMPYRDKSLFNRVGLINS